MLTNIHYEYFTWQLKYKKRNDTKAIAELEEQINGIDVQYLGWQLEEITDLLVF